MGIRQHRKRSEAVQVPGQFTNSVTGTINKSTAGDLQIGLEIITPNLDLDIFLLQGDCSAATCVASSTSSNTITNNEGILLEDAPTGTYYLVVDGQFSTSQGDYRLEVNCGYLVCTFSNVKANPLLFGVASIYQADKN